MSQPTPDDVFGGVRARLAADAAFTTRLPGGAHFGRKPGGKAFPYLVGQVEEDEPFAEQSNCYLQNFTVELTIWCESADGAEAETAAARAWLDGLLGWKAGDAANGVSVPNADHTVHVKPAGGKLELSDDLRQGQDVLAAGKRIVVCVQGSRG